MKIYLNGFEVVNYLHNNGFTQDFHLFGNDLFWIQEKIFIREHEFSITEYYEIIEPSDSLNELIVFGIFSSFYQVKGILVNHYKRYTDLTPAVIIRKLKELSTSVEQKEKKVYLYQRR